jgi:hypothetical protein
VQDALVKKQEQEPPKMTASSTFASIAIAVAVLAAWITHIVWIIQKLASDAGATFGQMALGAIGAFMPPVGVIHGVMIWLGVGL